MTLYPLAVDMRCCSTHDLLHAANLSTPLRRMEDEEEEEEIYQGPGAEGNQYEDIQVGLRMHKKTVGG
jgi:hypothetical protein